MLRRLSTRRQLHTQNVLLTAEAQLLRASLAECERRFAKVGQVVSNPTYHEDSVAKTIKAVLRGF